MEFNKEVLEKSVEKPVVVDFWASWCQPCLVLGPIIEKLAEEQKDRWELVKVNTDEQPELMQSYDIRGIPAVKMFNNGEVIAEFTGAQPRHVIQSWLDENLPDEQVEELAEIQKQLKELPGDPEALASLEQVVSEHPEKLDAKVILANQIVFEHPERASELVKDVLWDHQRYDQAEDIRSLATLMLINKNGAAPVADKLVSAKDALMTKDFEKSIQFLIDAVLLDKNFNDELPRKAAIALFRSLGEEHPISQEYRRKFNMALF